MALTGSGFTGAGDCACKVLEWGGLGGALDVYIGVGAKLASKVSSPSCFPVKLRSHGRFEDKFWRSRRKELV